MTTTRLANDKSNARQNALTGLICFLSIVVIGVVDYFIGYRISLLSFYAIPVGCAAIYAGPEIAFLLALCAVATSRGGDLLSGMPNPGSAVVFWNCVIPLIFFIFFILVLRLLQMVRLRLEKTVEDRNRALLQEMQERSRLEREVIELSEREHRRFGQELHDLVSQELASIAIDSHFLARNLITASHADGERARDTALKVDRALAKARNIARGYFTLGLDATGLSDALREVAARTQKESGITCKVACADNLVIGNEDATVQLFRIAQEAIQNAARHSAATEITISFERRNDDFILAVADNGKGLPATPGKKQGLGFSVMAYRASLIGGNFSTERPSDGGGTRIVCRVPAVKLTREAAAVEA